MGADLVCAYTSIEASKDPDWKAAEAMIANANAGDAEAYEQLLTAYVDVVLCGDTENEFEVEDVLAFATRSLNFVRDTYNGELRSSVTLAVKSPAGLLYVPFAGDMSWGDPPSGVDEIEFFNLSGLAEAAGFLV